MLTYCEDALSHFNHLLLRNADPSLRSETLNIVPENFLVTIRYPGISSNNCILRYMCSVKSKPTAGDHSLEYDTSTWMNPEGLVNDSRSRSSIRPRFWEMTRNRTGYTYRYIIELTSWYRAGVESFPSFAAVEISLSSFSHTLGFRQR